ncbi:unnamed protein product [Fraxinus pennsylvanica]|uniref:DUF4408 domain-containing protein n=1 Tax=Fraxinus pennsylvanica TaxID=56036 RepID=A0AAD2AA56_9LAMI|nr:unnamed protein product [Fraxinus pennsylvanica]
MINAAESMVATLKSCLTPTVIFCILNLTIAIIYITSSLNRHHILGDHEDNSRPQLVQVPPLFERVDSINLPIYRSEQPDRFDDATAPREPTHQQKYEAEKEDVKRCLYVEENHVTRSTSEPCVKAPVKRVLKKSASEKVYVAEPEAEADRQWPATAREMKNLRETVYYDENEDVDAKADDFINRFRQQLKLQSVDSILSNKTEHHNAADITQSDAPPTVASSSRELAPRIETEIQDNFGNELGAQGEYLDQEDSRQQTLDINQGEIEAQDVENEHNAEDQNARRTGSHHMITRSKAGIFKPKLKATLCHLHFTPEIFSSTITNARTASRILKMNKVKKNINCSLKRDCDDNYGVFTTTTAAASRGKS